MGGICGPKPEKPEPHGPMVEPVRIVKAVSPTFTWKRVDGGTEVTVEDVNGTSTVVIPDGSADVRGNRVVSLTDTPLGSGEVVESVGVPIYVSDVSQYADWGITKSGWYVFARINAKDDTVIGDEVTVTGVEGFIRPEEGAYVDVAVRFGVAAESQLVTVNWGEETESFVFKCTDLAVRNLDYRTTFYVYDVAEYVTWLYSQVTTGTFESGKTYYTKDGDVYSKAEVTTGEAIPTAYYEQEAPTYTLTADTAFVEGKAYYTKNGEDEYEAATVETGAEVIADTYYELSAPTYALTTDTAFVEGKTYYTLSDNTYTQAEVVVGEHVPAFFTHSKVRFEGMVRNVTYRLDETVDCPMEFVLPEIEDSEHGCWFEIRCKHAGEYSMTLIPPSSDVKIATEHTQKETAGINMIDLHYTDIDGTKLWRFMNTHSSIPA